MRLISSGRYIGSVLLNDVASGASSTNNRRIYGFQGIETQILLLIDASTITRILAPHISWAKHPLDNAYYARFVSVCETIKLSQVFISLNDNILCSLICISRLTSFHFHGGEGLSLIFSSALTLQVYVALLVVISLCLYTSERASSTSLLAVSTRALASTTSFSTTNL
ncbi:hypothetical protein V6N13_105109 [Hibiscus sabdariffa]